MAIIAPPRPATPSAGGGTAGPAAPQGSDPDLSALSRLPLLAGAGPEALAMLARRAAWRRLEPGEVAVDFGDATTDVFFVVEGTVRVVVRTEAGHEVILNELRAGELFGEIAAIDGAPRSANVTALHRSSLCVVPGEAFLELVLGSPPVGLRLLRTMTERLRAKDERVLELAVLPVRHRLYAELLRQSRDRADGTGQRVISPPPPHHVLAARIGARREAVSREISDLSRTGLVSADRRAIVLLRPERLRAAIRAQLRGAAADGGA
jgi:CRP-like cAMP-binding protein